MFPPHARGWTRATRPSRSPTTVSPARAGMDPVRAVRADQVKRFPRTRGDGPGWALTHNVSRRFPPHARGWTCRRTGHIERLTVSPARAGMDRCSGVAPMWDTRFPRTRGDGPPPYRSDGQRGRFPPHARGWTQITGELLQRGRVSPARAGMDLNLVGVHRDDLGSPRTRGDGPVTPSALKTCSRFPPHARGWTVLPTVTEFAHGVSPARAGMDPCAASTWDLDTCFPRTRGDGPGCNSA